MFQRDKYCIPYTRNYLFDRPLLTVQQLPRDNLHSWIRSIEEAIATRQCQEKLHQELSKNVLYRFLSMNKPKPVTGPTKDKNSSIMGAIALRSLNQVSPSFSSKGGSTSRAPSTRTQLSKEPPLWSTCQCHSSPSSHSIWSYTTVRLPITKMRPTKVKGSRDTNKLQGRSNGLKIYFNSTNQMDSLSIIPPALTSEDKANRNPYLNLYGSLLRSLFQQEKRVCKTVQNVVRVLPNPWNHARGKSC